MFQAKYTEIPNSAKAPSFRFQVPNNGASLNVYVSVGPPPRKLVLWPHVLNRGGAIQAPTFSKNACLFLFFLLFLFIPFLSISSPPPVSLLVLINWPSRGFWFASSPSARHAVQVVSPRFSGLAGLWRSCSRGACVLESPWSLVTMNVLGKKTETTEIGLLTLTLLHNSRSLLPRLLLKPPPSTPTSEPRSPTPTSSASSWSMAAPRRPSSRSPTTRTGPSSSSSPTARCGRPRSLPMTCPPTRALCAT